MRMLHEGPFLHIDTQILLSDPQGVVGFGWSIYPHSSGIALEWGLPQIGPPTEVLIIYL